MKNTWNLFRHVHRRDFLRVGGLGLCGVTLLDVLRGQSIAASPLLEAKAKHLICVWFGGGPPHTDMFDMKPKAAAENRGEFKTIDQPPGPRHLRADAAPGPAGRQVHRHPFGHDDEQAGRTCAGTVSLADR